MSKLRKTAYGIADSMNIIVNNQASPQGALVR